MKNRFFAIVTLVVTIVELIAIEIVLIPIGIVRLILVGFVGIWRALDALAFMGIDRIAKLAGKDFYADWSGTVQDVIQAQYDALETQNDIKEWWFDIIYKNLK